MSRGQVPEELRESRGVGAEVGERQGRGGAEHQASVPAPQSWPFVPLSRV